MMQKLDEIGRNVPIPLLGNRKEEDEMSQA
jgi:hypothetical protein